MNLAASLAMNLTVNQCVNDRCHVVPQDRRESEVLSDHREFRVDKDLVDHQAHQALLVVRDPSGQWDRSVRLANGDTVDTPELQVRWDRWVLLVRLDPAELEEILVRWGCLVKSGQWVQ